MREVASSREAGHIGSDTAWALRAGTPVKAQMQLVEGHTRRWQRWRDRCMLRMDWDQEEPGRPVQVAAVAVVRVHCMDCTNRTALSLEQQALWQEQLEQSLREET